MKICVRRSMITQSIFNLVLVFSFVILGGMSSAAQIIVTTAADGVSPEPPGSLRAAIIAVNANPDTDVITFDPLIFPPTLQTVITLVATALPHLIGPGDTIDGTGTVVVLDGTNLTALAAAGLRVRASNYTIQGLTFQNFLENDAIVVEGRNATPVVADVTISGNAFFNNRRGVRIDGSTQDNNAIVTASILDNILLENERGILVRGNATGSDGGNAVTAVIDGNTVQGKGIDPQDAGSGIDIFSGSDIGSNNIVTAIVTNNTVTQVRNDGIVVRGCTTNATGMNNTVNATITGNNVKFNQNLPPSNLNNNGIVISGASGESAGTSFCFSNTLMFLVSQNRVDGFKDINILVTGGDIGTHHNIVQGGVVLNHVTGAGARGISVGAGAGNNQSVAVVISDNISNSNGAEGIRVTGGTGGTGSANSVAVGGIINNTASRNLGDGIAVRGGVPGINGGTLVTGNRTDRNGEDGIDINSPWYVLSNNSASNNVVDGINAVGNVNGGGNIAKNNGSCNTPGCFQ